MRVVVFANWGIGAEVVRVLNESEGIRIDAIFSDFKEHPVDPWTNAVQNIAREIGTPCYRQRNQDDPDVENLLDECDLLMVHAWKCILPERIFTAPRLGAVNLHPSLLPKYRGRSPHLQVFRNRDAETGMTSHFIDKGVDTGPIIARISVPLTGFETIEDLIELQKPLIRPLLKRTLTALTDRNFRPISQNILMLNDS